MGADETTCSKQRPEGGIRHMKFLIFKAALALHPVALLNT